MNPALADFLKYAGMGLLSTAGQRSLDPGQIQPPMQGLLTGMRFAQQAAADRRARERQGRLDDMAERRLGLEGRRVDLMEDRAANQASNRAAAGTAMQGLVAPISPSLLDPHGEFDALRRSQAGSILNNPDATSGQVAIARDVLKPTSGNAREQKISSYMEAYGLSRPKAMALVDGKLATETDGLGRVWLFNKADINDRELVVDPQAPGAAVNSTATPADTARPMGAPDPSLGDVSYEAAAEEATGLASMLARTWNNVWGAFGGEGEPFPQDAEAVRVLQMTNNEVIRAITKNPRFPVAEQERIRGMLPSEGAWLSNPEGQAQKANMVRRFLRTQNLADEYAYNNTRLGPKDREALLANIKTRNDILGMMGDEPYAYRGMAVGSRDMPFAPTTMDEFSTIPVGGFYIHPDDGRLYEKTR